MARCVLTAVCAVLAIGFASAPGEVLAGPHHPPHPGVAPQPRALTFAPSMRRGPAAPPRFVPPREPGVGRPLPGTFAGGFDPAFFRQREIVVIREAPGRIAVDVSVNTVQTVVGIRPSPVGEPAVIRVGEGRLMGQHAHRLHARSQFARHHHHQRGFRAAKVR